LLFAPPVPVDLNFGPEKIQRLREAQHRLLPSS